MLDDRITILLIEDDPNDALFLERALSAAKDPAVHFVHVGLLEQGFEILAGGGIDLVILDLSLPDAAVGTEAVARVHDAAPEIPIVVLTGFDDDATAIDAMKCGAQDYLVKGQVNRQLLTRSIRYALERKRAEENTQRLLLEQAARAKAEALAARLRILSDVSRALATSFDYATTLAAATNLAVPLISDFCFVDILEGRREMRRVAAVGSDPAFAPLLQQLRRFPPDPSHTERPVYQAMHAGTAVVLNSLSDARLAFFARDDEHLAYLRALPATSGLVIPLTARGHVLGTLSLLRTGKRAPYESDEIAFAEDFASRVALALDNACLFSAREDVIGVVSHDLRNPLNVIGLCAAGLERELITTAERKRLVATVRRAVTRMSGLISDLLDMTRIEGGRLVLTCKGCAPGALLAEADEMFHALAEEKQITLKLTVEGDLPPVLADRERALQVFSNLIGNAIAFTPSGGTVTLDASVGPSHEVVFSVIDTGPGIPDEDRARVFDRFWQSDKTSRRGSGLGLNIAKGIVEAHGGRIWVESGPEHGSSFRFTLAREAQAAGSVTGAAS
jgi:signal transduction histidine kinase/DNA-binding NarL/FixJ family response regulator